MNQIYAIENLLRQIIGLDSGIIGTSTVERAVRIRMRARNLGRQDDYIKLLQQSPAEWDALVESVVVAETWFFREKEAFQVMVKIVLGEWLPAHPHRILRILSLPCSTGEEPYSIAMALMEAGVPESRFQIEAIDISASALVEAQHAVYGNNSFRGHDLEFRARYFQPLHRGYALNPSVKKQVHFQRGNILADHFLTGPDTYDFIFCRNLLIYLDGTSQQKVLVKIRRLVSPTGMVFVGPAELPLATNNGFIATNHRLSFGCKKMVSTRKLPPAVTRASRRAQSAEWPEISATGIATARELHINWDALSPAMQPPQQLADLQEARELVDAGCLPEATAICEAHLRLYGVSAEAFYLLGLIRDFSGADMQATEFYRKALYLQPTHYEALIQWASLARRNGNDAHAQILLNRAERVKNQP
jgi:chemotaxis protein methyltransferase WspC